MSNKSEKRIEAKKRKAAAFLQLVKDEQIGASGSTMSTDPPDEAGSKKPKMAVPAPADKGSQLPDTVLTEYTKELRRRQKAAMQKPKVFLTLDELTLTHPMNEASGEVKQLPPLFITDVQHLLLQAIQGQQSSYRPRWCRLLRVGKVSKVVVVVADAVSAEDFQRYSESLPTLKYSQDMSVEMVCPLQYSSSVNEELFKVPLSMMQMKKLNLQKDFKKALRSSGHRELTPVSGEKISQPVCTSDQDKFDRTCLLLNTAQMMYEGYPMPVHSKSQMYYNFVPTKTSYCEVRSDSPIYAIDCEMVQTDQRMNELARISVINEKLECVYDTFVKPHNRIINYVTRYSGITKAILDPVTTRLADVQLYLHNSLPPDAILVGQSLNADFISMKMFHPYVIDTSVVYNLTGNRRMKTGLRKLTAYFLGRSIQDSADGHCSCEDATATMELVLLKLRNGLAFGDVVMSPPTMDNAAPGPTETPGRQQTDGSGGQQTDGPGGQQTDGLGGQQTDMPCRKLDEEPGGGCAKCGSNNNKAVPVTCTCDTRTSEASSDIDENKAESRAADPDGTPSVDNDTPNDTPPAADEQTAAHPIADTLNGAPSASEMPSADNPTADTSNDTRTAAEQETSRRRMFFQRQGNKYIQNFFGVITNQHKSGKIVDEAANAGRYPVCKRYPAGLHQESCSDKDSERLTSAALADHDFTLTHLYGFRDHLRQHSAPRPEAGPGAGGDMDQMKKCLWKLDRRVWKIQKEVPPNSLFVVILPGRMDDQIYTAMTFAKIT